MNVEHNCLFGKADACRIPLADSSCALVLGSPPYCRARSYLEDGKDLGIARDCVDWVEWMMRVTQEAIRVSRGLVLWVCAGPTQDRNYQPGPEGLVWEWHRRHSHSGVWQDGIELPGNSGYQECPCYWHRVGIFGSGGDQWFRKDVEYVLAFKKTPVLPYSDNKACGHTPKWAPGGKASYRTTDGKRANAKTMKGKGHEGGRSCKVSGERGKNGEVQYYIPPDMANPGNWLDSPISATPNVLDITVGGGHLGSQWAHESEAPYPEGVPEFFIKSFTKPGDVVCDPFSGSGTTLEACEKLRRTGIGFDLRMSQCRIGLSRIERPHLAVLPSKKKDKPFLLLGETE